MSYLICPECAKENNPTETVCERCFSLLITTPSVAATPLLTQTESLTDLQQQLASINSHFDFLETLFEEITQLSGINFLAELELFILPLRFFCNAENAAIDYSNKFAQGQFSLNWQITCVHRLIHNKPLHITQVYKNAVGDIIHSQTCHAVIPANTTQYSISDNYLRDWSVGEYMLLLFIDNTKIAENYFHIY